MSAGAATSQVTCPAWCRAVQQPCNGDHFASPGSEEWPGVRATAYLGNDAPLVVFAPTWGQLDGLDPAVNLWITDGRGDDRDVDLRPDEARRLLEQLQRAIDAAAAC